MDPVPEYTEDSNYSTPALPKRPSYWDSRNGRQAQRNSIARVPPKSRNPFVGRRSSSVTGSQIHSGLTMSPETILEDVEPTDQSQDGTASSNGSDSPPASPRMLPAPLGENEADDVSIESLHDIIERLKTELRKKNKLLKEKDRALRQKTLLLEENERDFRDVDNYIDEIRKAVDNYKKTIDEC